MFRIEDDLLCYNENEFINLLETLVVKHLNRVNKYKGDKGLSAYEVALEEGFVGTKKQWLNSLKGKQGESTYDIAVKYGFNGTEQEWLGDFVRDVDAVNKVYEAIAAKDAELFAYLKSPDGKDWKISISNLGELVVTRTNDRN